MAITFAFKKVNVIQVIWSGLKSQLKEHSVVEVFAMSLYTSNCQVTSHANVSVYPFMYTCIVISHSEFAVSDEEVQRRWLEELERSELFLILCFSVEEISVTGIFCSRKSSQE